MGQRTLPEVRDGSVDPREGYRMGRGTFGRCPGRVGGPSGSYGTCQGTLGEVQYVSGDTLGGSRRVVDCRGGPGRDVGPSQMSGMGRGSRTKVREGSEDSRGGPVRFG